MKTKSLLIALFLIAALSFNGTVWAQINCCCTVKCTFRLFSVLTTVKNINKCFTYDNPCEDVDLYDLCEQEFPLYESWVNIDATGECTMEVTDDCESESLLGNDHPGLDILRQFRDGVLARSENGRRLTEAYYKYGDVLIEAFEENSGIEIFATEILVKTIERLEETLGSDEELLTDEIAADIDILIDELDASVESPQLKKTLRQIKRDMQKGTLF